VIQYVTDCLRATCLTDDSVYSLSITRLSFLAVYSLHAKYILQDPRSIDIISTEQPHQSRANDNQMYVESHAYSA
jgi:hypothetical protein